jgi:hypothetical protein
MHRETGRDPSEFVLDCADPVADMAGVVFDIGLVAGTADISGKSATNAMS